eukprot:481886-Prymnesium_polylepis.1
MDSLFHCHVYTRSAILHVYDASVTLRPPRHAHALMRVWGGGIADMGDLVRKSPTAPSLLDPGVRPTQSIGTTPLHPGRPLVMLSRASIPAHVALVDAEAGAVLRARVAPAT